MQEERELRCARRDLQAAQERLQKLKAALESDEAPVSLTDILTPSASLPQEMARLASLLKETQSSDASWREKWAALQQQAALLMEDVSQRDGRIAELTKALEDHLHQARVEDAATIASLEDQLRQVRAAEVARIEALQDLFKQEQAEEAAKRAALQAELHQIKEAEKAKIAALQSLHSQEQAEEGVKRQELQDRLATLNSEEARRLGKIQKRFEEQQAASAAQIQQLQELLQKTQAVSSAQAADLQEQLLQQQAVSAAQIQELQELLQKTQATAAAQIEEIEERLKAKQVEAEAGISRWRADLGKQQAASAAKTAELENQVQAERMKAEASDSQRQGQLEQLRAASAAQVEEIKKRLKAKQDELDNRNTEFEEQRLQQKALITQVEILEKQLLAKSSEGKDIGEDLKRTLEAAKISTRAQVEELEKKLQQAQKRIEELSQPGPHVPEPAAEPAALAPEEPGMAPTMPSLEPVLESGWSKVLDFMRRSLNASYAHLRKLSATPLANDQRARLKLAAGALAQGTDALTALGEFLDEAGPAPSAARLETPVTAAIAVWEPAMRQRGISLGRHMDADLPAVLFHPEGLRLALYQVLRNAYESMPRNGSLIVKVFKDAATGAASVSFSDTGTGFSREALARFPTPFATTKAGHLGLGLAMVHRLLERWGGSLEAANNEKIGALVTLRFSADQGEPPPMQPDALP